MTEKLQPISITASVTLDPGYHHKTPLVLDVASGCTVTLPASDGSGTEFNFMVGTLVTSNTYVIAANGSDVMAGIIDLCTDSSGIPVVTSATSDKITMNGGTQGGVPGTWIKLVDAKSGTWTVTGSVVSTGAESTPFSAS